jgi:UDP-N-acetylglucosamine acyltransferase
MAYCHIAHDCLIGSHCVFANNSTLAGHVEVHDYATLGGFSGVHQFCRLGENSFSAISTIIVKDVPPFFMVSGNTARARGVNKVGLRRRGFSGISIEAVKKCYKLLYMKGIGFDEAVKEIAKEGEIDPQAHKIDQFIKASQRGIVR